jgi:hypothetical protein
MVTLSDEASKFLEQKNCNVFIIPIVAAVKKWNKDTGSMIELYH